MIETRLGNLRRLQVFVEVAEQLNFSRAARRLLITQPSVSRQVRELEAEIGEELFHRGKSISLTETGQNLYGFAKKILALVEDMEATLLTARGRVAGHVALGGSETLEPLVASAVIDFRVAHPEVDATVRIGPAQHITEMVLDDRLAFGILDQQPKDARLEVQKLAAFEQELVVVMPPGHALAERGVVRPRDLEAFPFIHYPREHPGYIDGVLNELGVRPTYAIEIESLQGIKEAVARGIGISLLPMPTVHYEPPERMLFRSLRGPLLQSAYYAIRSRYRHFTTAEQALFDALVAVFSAPIDLVTVDSGPAGRSITVRARAK